MEKNARKQGWTEYAEKCDALAAASKRAGRDLTDSDIEKLRGVNERGQLSLW